MGPFSGDLVKGGMVWQPLCLFRLTFCWFSSVFRGKINTTKFVVMAYNEFTTSVSVWQPQPVFVVPVDDVVVAGSLVWVLLATALFSWASFRVVVRLVRLLGLFLVHVAWVSVGVLSSPFWVMFYITWPLVSWTLPGQVSGVPFLAQTDNCGQVVGQEGGVAEAKVLPVTAHLHARLRPRARWVKSLEAILGDVPSGAVGMLVKGRWTPDLPSPSYSPGLNLVLAHRGDGVKLLGGGAVRSGEEGNRREPYFVVELPDGCVETVFPHLLATLSSYAFLRKREATLVLALRSRALDWCKRRGLSDSSTLVAVSMTPKWAWIVTVPELKAREEIREDATEVWWA